MKRWRRVLERILWNGSANLDVEELLCILNKRDVLGRDSALLDELLDASRRLGGIPAVDSVRLATCVPCRGRDPSTLLPRWWLHRLGESR